MMRNEAADGHMSLIGHTDRNNPQSSMLVPGQAVSFVFQGPSAYASPDLYPDKQLPGWFYVMVKGHGTVSNSIDGAAAIEMLCRASQQFGGPEQRFALTPDDARFGLFIGGVVGFEISVKEISGIVKIAQDKGPAHAELARRYLCTQSRPGSDTFLSAVLNEEPAAVE
jgi:transcriptional regulator